MTKWKVKSSFWLRCIVNLDFLTTKQRKIFQVRYKPHGFSPVLSCSFMFSGFLSGHDERFVKGIIFDSVNWVIVHGHPINEECLRHVSNACHACQVSIRFLAWRRPKLTFRTYSSDCDKTWTFPTLLPKLSYFPKNIYLETLSFEVSCDSQRRF